MSGRFVRASKFRHVFGQPFKKEKCYENLKVTISAFDSNIVKCNGKYISVNANGIGSFIVIPVEEVGKAPDKVPMFRGHTGGSVMDTDFNPFDENKLASAGEDGKILLWEIPEDYTFTKIDTDKIVDVAPVAALTGHSRKVGHILYHPVAENVLASSSFDYSIKIWNLDTLKCEKTLQHKDLVTSFSWNFDGTKIVTASRDKKLRVWDVQTGEIISEGPGHTGAKVSRVCWLGNTNRLATTGFDRYSERQLGVWNADKIEDGPIGGFYSVDASSGVLMPFFDPSTNILFVAGKGDGNVRYYEYEKDELYLISEYQSTSPQRGYAVGPKKHVSVKDNEIVRAYKLLNDNSVEPISYIVPRRSEMFQEDIYPDAPAGVPALSAEEFFAGKKSGPVLVSMKDLYEGVDSPATTVDETERKVEEQTEQPKKEEPKKEPKKEPKEAPKEEPKPEVKEEPKAKAVDFSSNTGTIDDLKNQKEVTSLLNKVHDLSDDDTQDVDGDDDDDWQQVPREVEAKKETTPAKEEPKVVSAPEKKEQQETPKPEESVKTVAESETPVEEKEVPKSAVTEEPKSVPASAASAGSAGSAAGRAAGGLKTSIEKLQTLVTNLESVVEQLQASNLAKDKKLESLEEKIDQLLTKSI